MTSSLSWTSCLLKLLNNYATICPKQVADKDNNCVWKENFLLEVLPNNTSTGPYYPTVLSRVQVTPKTSTNFMRKLYSGETVRQLFSQRASDELDWSCEKKNLFVKTNFSFTSFLERNLKVKIEQVMCNLESVWDSLIELQMLPLVSGRHAGVFQLCSNMAAPY